MSELDVFRERLSQALEARGLNKKQLSLLLGKNPAYIQQLLDPKRDHMPAGANIGKIAQAVQVTPSWLLGFEGVGPEHGLARDEMILDVIGAVEAGHWAEADEWRYREQRHVAWRRNPSVPSGLPVTGLLVRGTSMNREYPEGAVVVVVRYADLAHYGRDPLPGDRVVVVRQDRRGLFESTLKVLEIEADGTWWLQPKSNDPRHREGFRYPEAPAFGESADLFATRPAASETTPDTDSVEILFKVEDAIPPTKVRWLD